MEISVTPPTAEVRYETLKSILSEIDVSIAADKKEKQQDNNSSLTTEDLMNIADLTVGYVAADLSSLVRRALLLSISDNQNGQSNVMSIKHLLGAMQNVGASALRDASASAPPVTTWDDIAGDAGGAKVSTDNFVCN
jgi:SpoVK/Ycf46/Vps4 family AAA+-type ATPase